MRKSYWIVPTITIVAAFLLLFTSEINASTDGLTLTAPASCPTAGCAAGQRLNIQVEFSPKPVYQGGNNTQICFYAPSKGQAVGTAPWADFSDGWISTSGLLTGIAYTQGEIASMCTDNADPLDSFLTGAYAAHPTASTDQLELAFRINQTTVLDGDVKVKVLQVSANGSSWTVSDTFTQSIEVAPQSSPAYVAKAPADCQSFSPCYVNSGDDASTGQGTGLRDAILSLNPGDEIFILNDYVIKNNTILVDKDLAIIGQDKASLATIGTDCSQPLLKFTQSGSLENLTINDGNCSIPTSRNLVEIDSAGDVAIEHNTFSSGKRAIHIKDNTGDVTIAFNQLSGNQDYAIYRETGTTGSGWVNIFANNTFNNRTGFQVFCGGFGSADHNYWGAGISPAESISGCSFSNGKQLGAAILLDTETAGVQAIRKTVTNTLSYVFNDRIGVAHPTGQIDYDLIIVNHGQGTETNIPFLSSGAGTLKACSNFYDVFLADDAVALNLDLSLRYDLNSTCVSTIESNTYCGQSESSKYPLWWYDPASNVTDGWDTTGQAPGGTAAGGAEGQTTTCHLNKKEIRVAIDLSGRPGINSDLNYTPFVVGLPIVDGVTLSQFTATFDVNKVNLMWMTSSETNIKGFYVLRSEKENGTYTRISSQISAIGDSYIGGIYNYADNTNITKQKTYYYKIEVISTKGASIQILGPVSVLTSTPTPTVTLTRTPYPTRTPFPTQTLYPTRYVTPYYRTPTPISYSTATPVGRPTQVRTYGPTSTSDGIYPVEDPDFDNDPDSAYPPYPFQTAYPDGYPAPGDDAVQTATAENPASEKTPGSSPSPTPSTPPGGQEPDDSLEARSLRWFFILIGAASGLGLLGAVGVILARKYLS